MTDRRTETDDAGRTMADVDHRPPNGVVTNHVWRRGTEHPVEEAGDEAVAGGRPDEQAETAGEPIAATRREDEE